ncbi:39S ribosomal protein L59, mitochondrial [Aphelenchoides besseyi]|nr:39S ribosomal protein L59, mitochondrial [Aphelenchoides besseyi]
MFTGVLIRRFVASSSNQVSKSTAETVVNEKIEVTRKIKIRLNERHQTLLEDRIPPMSYEEAKGKTVLGERFGVHGLKSAVDIRRLWPTVEEIERNNQMKLRRTADEAKRLAEKLETEKSETLTKREQEVDENYKKWVESLKNQTTIPVVEAKSTPEVEGTKPIRFRGKKR